MPSATNTLVQQALNKAKETSHWAVGMCDNFVANMYGYASSGYATAQANWNATPANLRHPGDMQAPAGALMFWGGGDGHVAISMGDGTIRSTDIGGLGTVTTAKASTITQKWGKPYLGWAYPYFQGKAPTTTLGLWTGSTSVTNGEQTGIISDTLDPGGITKGFVDSFTAPFKSLLGVMIWGTETMVGLALLGAGVFIIVRTRIK